MKTRLLIVGLLIALGLLGWSLLRRPYARTAEPIRVGILHSLTGTMAISEQAVVDATLMAIAEINERGGLLSREVEPVVLDGRSDWPTFARQAEALITEHRVGVIFGCWTSASRKAVKPVLERHDHLLFYPLQYEGLELSANIVYTGASPNQQVIPAVKWCFDHLGNRFFLVGSDYVFPRTANAIIKDQIAAFGGRVVGEEYVLLGSSDVTRVIERIVASRPDVLLNTINGNSNVAFFHELRAAGITPEKIPTMSFSIAEHELRSLGAAQMVGDYACWNYFQSIDSPVNAKFVADFKQRYGPNQVTDDPMEAAYFGVYLWAQAVKEAGSVAPGAVRRTIKSQSFNAPEGIVYIDAENQHTWKMVRIGQITKEGQFEIRWSSEKPVRPVPYPIFRPRWEWESFLNHLSSRWGGEWANPGG